MPVKKYRSIEEMEPVWHEPGSRELYEAIKEVWAFGARVLQPRFPPGVHKYRSFEEMQEAEEEWNRRNFERYRARLRSG